MYKILIISNLIFKPNVVKPFIRVDDIFHSPFVAIVTMLIHERSTVAIGSFIWARIFQHYLEQRERLSARFIEKPLALGLGLRIGFTTICISI